MNLLILPIVKLYTRTTFLIFLFVPSLAIAWDVDMSRRQKDLNKYEQEYSARLPASLMNNDQKSLPSKNILERVLVASEPEQEIVILNTEAGFVPNTIRLKKDGSYKIVVVNVNEKEKNVSFIMDSFSEHHATYFGQIKTFNISPKLEGVFSFQSPETAAQGKVVVYSDSRNGIKVDLGAVQSRAPSSEK